jgi:hypothetical protein
MAVIMFNALGPTSVVVFISFFPFSLYSIYSYLILYLTHNEGNFDSKSALDFL